MPRPRVPGAKAKATGADVLHPSRFKDRTEPKSTPLGAPSDVLSDDERRCWESFKREMPWLMESDRTLVEVACRLRARMWGDPNMGVQALAQLRMCVSAMGGTPSDRSKVTSPDDDGSDDPGAAYFN